MFSGEYTSPLKAGLGLASPAWTRESQLTAILWTICSKFHHKGTTYPPNGQWPAPICSWRVDHVIDFHDRIDCLPPHIYWPSRPLTVHWQPTMLELHRDSSSTPPIQGPKIATWGIIKFIQIPWRPNGSSFLRLLTPYGFLGNIYEFGIYRWLKS